MRKPPFFIVGCPRSGTTLLQYMLRSHPSLSVPTGESHFFIAIYRELQKNFTVSRPEAVRKVINFMVKRSRSFLETDLHGYRFTPEKFEAEVLKKGCRSVPEVFDLLFSLNARGENKERWGDKTPWYLLHMPTITEMFPGAQFIHIIRDGRDVALSLFKRRHDFGIYNIYKAAELWTVHVEKGQALGADMPGANYCEVRYEDLLTEPEKVMRKICSFLNEEFVDEVIHFKPSKGGGKTPLLQKPVQAGNAYKWKRNLSERQQRIFEGVAGMTLKRNGYECRYPGVSENGLGLKCFARAHHCLANLFYNRTWVGL